MIWPCVPSLFLDLYVIDSSWLSHKAILHLQDELPREELQRQIHPQAEATEGKQGYASEWPPDLGRILCG